MIRALSRWLNFLRTVYGAARPRVLKNDLARVRRLQRTAGQAAYRSQLRPGQLAGRTFGDTQ